jgi:hypothetical protein
MSPPVEPFNRVLVALEPWLDHIVIIGGWAHRLYRIHPSAQHLDYPPLTTLDTDVAIPSDLPRVPGIDARMTAHGFVAEFWGDDRPPATHYRLHEAASGFYVEFVTPLAGGPYDRRGKRKATVEIAGIASQRLRYIELLLDHPWTIDFRAGDFRALVRIANPASFLAQKILIQPERERAERAKDILYIHDTIEVFGARLAELRDLWREIVAPQLRPNHAKVVSRAAQSVFGAVTDDIRRAAQVAAERRLSAEAIREVGQYGLAAIFG